jgi:hypothetical protein
MPYDSENNFFETPDDGRKALSGPVEIDVMIYRGGKVVNRVYPIVYPTTEDPTEE